MPFKTGLDEKDAPRLFRLGRLFRQNAL